MAEKKTAAKPSEIDSLSDIKADRPKSDTARTQEKKGERLVKIKALRTIRSFYGALDAGNFYELPESYVNILCADGRAEICS